MRIRFLAVLLCLATALPLLAHAGHQHHFLGTVKSLAGDQLTIVTPEGKDAAFTLTATTAYLREGATASRTDLTPGTRVAVAVADDGKTAVSVKLGK